MIIAIDGPAAAGKGTLARKLAEHLGYAYLDTGALYRAVGLARLRAGGELADESLAAELAAAPDLILIEDPDLRTEATGDAASVVAAMPGVRANLLQFQREFASSPPNGEPGSVIDGRDIGTVVCPDADVKLFVSASPEERARRRHLELRARGETPEFDTVLADVEARDARDKERENSPLKPAVDAHLLDTTNLDIEAAFSKALSIVNQLLAPE